MVPYIQQLRQSKAKHIVAFQEFALSTKTKKNHLFVFFEGKDNPYYMPRIKVYTQNVVSINCSGRSNVLKVFNLIKNQEVYNVYSKAFFIDKDFNSTLTENKDLIFETPCYSIENLYVNRETFEQILINDFQISINDDNFKVCKLIFDNRFKEFNRSVALFNAWYSCLIDIKNQTNQEIGAKLNDKLPPDYISISLDRIEKNYDLNRIKETFAKALEVKESLINKKISEFNNCNSELVFRGKYQMEFFITILQLIINESKKNNGLITNKIKFAFDDALNHLRALTIFSNYAKTPSDLNTFLESIVNKN